MKTQASTKPVAKLNHAWIAQTRQHFLEFLSATNFPEPLRHGIRGSTFEYPEWVVMFIAMLSVKCKEKTYLGIHRMTRQYWELITPDKNSPPISESQLRERLKKICREPRTPSAFILQLFPQAVLD